MDSFSLNNEDSPLTIIDTVLEPTKFNVENERLKLYHKMIQRNKEYVIITLNLLGKWDMQKYKLKLIMLKYWYIILYIKHKLNLMYNDSYSKPDTNIQRYSENHKAI